MGIDYDGGMIVGCYGEDLPEDLYKNYESFYEYVEDKGFDVMHPYQDCPCEESYIGLRVNDTGLSETEFKDFCEEVSEKAKEFERVTGITPSLIGTQNIW